MIKTHFTYEATKINAGNFENACNFVPNGENQKRLREDSKTPEGAIAVINASSCAIAYMVLVRGKS